ncbi:tripartite tricarboxylate transporter TctB family protein [Halomonas sp. FeN2]|uniref:tripartite tricarboxylate transporter TctB family protein n=1 Tax=Halomonadaceae TaxID=28256 RepID=UPI001D0AB156|nr:MULTISPECIES: tripartite tricarboxylate transporter TctB family protein [unclassified Halomonas]UBR51642.1 tripartite tricarboxylate transporter TctB family protein [Halomonas sp. FeN2]|tara:strand:+ start:785 stop:1246 length:462 start_codon:yes stop_codon:yes gene_type:complete
MTLPDRIGGVVLLTLGVAVVIASLGLPAIPGQPVGPAIFPSVLGVALGLSGLIIFVKPERQPAQETQQLEALSVIGTLRLLSPVAVLILGYLIMESLGFLVTGFLIVLVISLLLRGSVVGSLLLSAVMTVVIYTIFASLLRVPLPAGILSLPW